MEAESVAITYKHSRLCRGPAPSPRPSHRQVGRATTAQEGGAPGQVVDAVESGLSLGDPGPPTNL